MGRPYRYRSFFWPAVLVLIGGFALLLNTGVLAVDRLYRLAELWPLILIVSGVEIIIRRSLHGVTGDLAAALVVLLAVGGALAYVALAPNPNATASVDSSAPVDNLEQVALELDVGAATINVTSSTSIGADLYRAHIDYTGPQPEISLDRSLGTLRISQPSGGLTLFQDRRFTLDLKLSPEVPWTITENSGATTDTMNLSGLHVGGVTLNTGASRDDITLGPPSGVVSVTVNGGALTVHVHRPVSTPVAVGVSGGAVSLVADGREMRAVGNVSYEAPGFASAADAYRVTVNGGACTVTVDSAGT